MISKKKLTIVHHGCDLFWQISPMNMMIWNRLTNLPLFLIFNLTIFTYGHALHLSAATLMDTFFCKNHIKIKFDNFPPWLWPIFSGWQFSTVAVNFIWQFYNVAFTQKIKQILVDNFTTFSVKIGWQFYFLTKVL